MDRTFSQSNSPRKMQPRPRLDDARPPPPPLPYPPQPPLPKSPVPSLPQPPPPPLPGGLAARRMFFGDVKSGRGMSCYCVCIYSTISQVLGYYLLCYHGVALCHFSCGSFSRALEGERFSQLAIVDVYICIFLALRVRLRIHEQKCTPHAGCLHAWCLYSTILITSLACVANYGICLFFIAAGDRSPAKNAHPPRGKPIIMGGFNMSSPGRNGMETSRHYESAAYPLSFSNDTRFTADRLP